VNIRSTPLSGVLVVETSIHRDHRGHFIELYRQSRYDEAGIQRDFVQDNLSYSTANVLRGLHYQNPSAQSKLVSALFGEVWDVVVDIRQGSPTFGKWFGETLSNENGFQMWVPEGFAHGFVVLSPQAVVSYKVSTYFDSSADGSVLWNDPDIGIEWPVAEPILSDKDARAPRLKDVPPERLRF
jgi:dTDP-4-dehydrorhamnose 3,5-epimerase